VSPSSGEVGKLCVYEVILCLKHSFCKHYKRSFEDDVIMEDDVRRSVFIVLKYVK
jgi:hypothetical protein